MWRSTRAAAMAAACLVGGCASPYFVNDPQGFLINRSEVPHLIKALRCELATYIAANNQRTVLFEADFATSGIKHAIATYPYFPMDTNSFGGIALDLKVQDTLGMQSGTQFDWKRTYNATHSKAWNIGPTASDQSTYEVTWSMTIPQDTYYLDNFSIPLSAINDDPFPCYKLIPHNPHPPFANPAALEDLDGLAANRYPDLPNFHRVWVDGAIPLAAWLQDVSREIGVTTFLSTNQTDPEAINPAQMIYIFTIQVTGGLDVKYMLTSSLWSAVAGEGSSTVQQTSTMTLVLNGVEAQSASGVKGGNVKNIYANPLPVILSKRVQHRYAGRIISAPNPGYVGRTQSRGILTYPIPLAPLGVPQ